MEVLVAETEDARRRGLSGIDSLPQGVEGMVFSYSSPSRVTFAMADTEIPLDVWFFDPQGSLVGSARMEPCDDEPCPQYRSPQAVLWALETPADRYEFSLGDQITFGE